MDTKTSRALCVLHHGFLSARFQRALLAHAPQTIERSLKKHALTTACTVHTAPHHLVIILDNIALHTTLKSKDLKGPFVDEGPQALADFLAHTQASRTNVHTKTLPHGECYFVHQPPQQVSTWPLVQEALMDALQAPFHKRMYWWENSSFLWARPIHGYSAFWGNAPQTLPLPERIPALKALPGHGIMHPEPIPLDPTKDPRETFRARSIILCHKERIHNVKTQLKNLKNLQPLSPHLIEDLAFSAQNPTLVICPINPKYASLDTAVTQHIIEAKMYAIPLHKNGTITHFATVVDQDASCMDQEAIIKGFCSVCHAALEDALFFMKKDTTTPLDSYAPALNKRLIHEDIGTLGEHIARLTSIVENGTTFGHNAQTIQQALSLMKCDLETLMVHEYPTLQGRIGTLYAHKQNIPEAVANAIYEHYLPLGPTSPIPPSDIGAICAFLDKTLTLVSFISVGRRPTSSKDPFGVRRLALGLIRIAEHYPWTGSFRTLITQCTNTLQQNNNQEQEDVTEFLKQFLQDRTIHYARATYPSTIISAACTTVFAQDWNIHKAFTLMRALHTHPHTATITQAYKRALHLAPIATTAPTITPTQAPDAALSHALSAHTHTEDFTTTLNNLHALSLVVEDFCNKTLIACEDQGLRKLREHMLQTFCTFCNNLAHFSALIETT